MRIRIVLTVLCVAICLSTMPLFAQSPISLLIKGGANLANISEIDSPDNIPTIETENLIGFAAGVGFRLPLGGSLSIQPEALYSLKGYQTKEYEFLGTTTQMKVKLTYVDVPILGVLSLNEQFDIYAGGYVDIYLNGELELEALGAKDTEDIESDDLKSPGYGAVAGVAFRTEKVMLEARYYHGISDILETNLDDGGTAKMGADDEDTWGYQHRVIQVMVGFAL